MKKILICLFICSLSLIGQPIHSEEQGNFTIIEDVTKSNQKRAITIRLKNKVKKEELAQIARQIKGTNKIKYKRTFILYYLPGMEIGAGAWATTHFDPKLKVRILGLSLESEKKLKSTAKNNIGSWIANIGIPGIITIFKKQSSYFFEQKYPDGGKTTKELIKKTSSKGTRFNQKDRPKGDYFIITKKGNLEVWDNLGLVYSYKSENPK
jgi:hypothetical protein